MPVEIESITPTKVSLTIEVESDKVKTERERVFREMAKGVNIKGFRKGKAPRKMIEKHINEGRLKQEVLEHLLPAACEQALKSNRLVPLTRPEYELLNFEDNKPLKFKVTFEKRPEIQLAEYKGLEVEVEKREIKEEEVEKTIQSLRELRAAYEDWPDGEVTEGEGAVLDFQGFVDGKPFPGGSSQGLLLEIKKDWIIPGFLEQLLGMKAGEEKEIRVTIPSNFEPLIAGKEAVFKVRVQTVKRRKLPEMNDDLAAAVGDFKTLNELREGIRKNMVVFHDNQERMEGFQKIMDKLTATVEFPVPDVLVEERLKQFEREALHVLEEQHRTFADFLKEKYPEVFAIAGVSPEEQTKRGIEKFREELRPRAIKMAKVDLILDEVWQKENLRVTQEEISSEIRRLAERYKMPTESIAKALKDNQAFQVFVAGMLRAKASIVIRDNLKISHKTGKDTA